MFFRKQSFLWCGNGNSVFLSGNVIYSEFDRDKFLMFASKMGHVLPVIVHNYNSGAEIRVGNLRVNLS
jgi:hypothetical protein